MGGGPGGVAGLDAAPPYDRFGQWPRWAARAVLAIAAIVLLAAALTYPAEEAALDRSSAAESPVSPAQDGVRDDDLQLYERIAERVREGENYYAVAVEEQRARDFPVRPGFAVRLPTLAFATAWLGETGLTAAAVLLALATLWAWWRRLGDEPGGAGRRTIALLLLVIGAAMGLKPQYLALHEVWAGMLLALSFGLHRPGRWVGAWMAAAAALAVREHALPFVLLMGALAVWRRDWKEATAWTLLVLLFGAALALHVAEVAEHVLPSDPVSSPWLVLRGLEGATTNVVLSSSLHLLTGWLAAPLALVPLLGWAGWRTGAGLFGTLLFGGYALFFMLAGRENNFYWALVVTPAWFVGLAFVPMAARSLWHRAR